MAAGIDMTGKRCGRLTVLSRVDNRREWSYWMCRCDCGNEIVTEGKALRVGHTKSCGCLSHETASNLCVSRSTHGMRRHPLYNVYQGMIKRCEKPSEKSYKDYGARGIAMCAEWRQDPLAFFRWALANGYKSGLTIDRIDNNGNYEPGNCRWADRITQGSNKRNNRRFEYRGESLTLAQLSRLSGLSPDTISARIEIQGLPVDRAVESPLYHRKK